MIEVLPTAPRRVKVVLGRGRRSLTSWAGASRMTDDLEGGPHGLAQPSRMSHR